jgi:hypothetical protein
MSSSTREQVEKLSPAAQSIIHSYTADLADSLSSHSPGSSSSSSSSSRFAATLSAWTAAVTGVLPWRTPSREDYLALLQESEYGAW